jgi:single-strand DNA-binding protein
LINATFIIGRLVADPSDLKYTPNGVAVNEFTVAVDRRKSGEDKQADFFNCVAWRQSAEYLANYGAKGRLVAIQGRLQQEKWVQQDGSKRSKVVIVCENVSLIDKPKQDSDTPSGRDLADAQGEDYPEFEPDPFE